MRSSTCASTLALAAVGLFAVTAAQAQTRDQIRIVGSSTVFPYTQAVAEEFARKTMQRSPVVESTGTGGGMRIFCQGVGPDHPDITGASRAMTASEYKNCVKNGVTDITELQIGSDGLSIAISRKNKFDWDLSERELFLALAAEVPDESGKKLIPNPNRTWNQINPKLPKVEIEVFGPPPTSGTRDAFVELTMHDGCMTMDYYKALRKSDSKMWDQKCGRMRTDGPFIEAGENDNLIVQRLQSNSNAMGIFGYSFLYENQEALKAVKVDGTEPNFDTIASGDYDIARPIFIYIKNAHRKVIPGLPQFIAEYSSEEALADGGYLADRGLTPLPEKQLKATQEAAKSAARFEGPKS